MSFVSVTEISGDEISKEQLWRMHNRYMWALDYCLKKDVVEVACGAGQGLGLLYQNAKSLEAGDIEEELVNIAQSNFGDKIVVAKFDCTELPYPTGSKDCIILFEAIYYIKDVDKFFVECKRVLRPGGCLLLSLANKSVMGFNPSPFSINYFSWSDLQKLANRFELKCKTFGFVDIKEVSILQQLLTPIKKILVALDLFPKTMASKKLLKRVVFGKLVKMPTRLDGAEFPLQRPKEIFSQEESICFKVLYCCFHKT